MAAFGSLSNEAPDLFGIIAGVVVDRHRATRSLTVLPELALTLAAGYHAAMLSAAHLKEVFDASPDCILVVDQAGEIREANAAATTMFGWDREDLLGQCVDVLVPPEQRTRHAVHRANYAQGPCVRAMGTGLRLFGLHRDGVRFPVEIALSPCEPVPQERLVVCTVRDVSAFQRWRTLAAAQAEAVESERRRVARELHDDIGQRLVFLKHRLTGTAFAGAASHRASDRYPDISGTIDEAIEAVDRLCRALTPSELDHFGLTIALKVMFRELATTGFRVRADLDEIGPEFDSAKALAVFRIVQEALANVRKHAGTDEAAVRLVAGPETVSIEVQDVGVGFDPATVAAFSEGLGLPGLTERATTVGGTLQLKSSPGAGTVVRASVPRRPIPRHGPDR